MRKEQRQKVWPWAALAFLVGPVLFSACSLFGLNISSGGSPVPLTATPTLVSTLVLPSATASLPATALPATPLQAPPLPRTLTPAVSLSTSTPVASATPVATSTPGQTPVSPASQQKPEHFALQIGSPKYIPAFAHTDQGCQWIGLAGQVFDANGAGASGIAVQVSGSIDGEPFQWKTLTAEQSPFGPGGYEIFLTNHISTTPQAALVQLFDAQGQPLSDPVPVIVPDQCDQNLILINFVNGDSPHEIFIPALSR